MATKLQNIKWKLYSYKKKKLLISGLRNGLITPYDDELIEKLRKVYYGGIPASILLLSDHMSNGFCYDRALLLAKAFINEEDDIKLLYATINSIKLNPKFISYASLHTDNYINDLLHCVLERTTKDGRKLIYDTSQGFIYDKKIYWLIEQPKIKEIDNKESIKEFLLVDEHLNPSNIENDKYITPLILPSIEMYYGKPNEIYSMPGIELLQREIELYKKAINYDKIREEISKTKKRKK